jgi:hypothetical protein
MQTFILIHTQIPFLSNQLYQPTIRHIYLSDLNIVERTLVQFCFDRNPHASCVMNTSTDAPPSYDEAAASASGAASRHTQSSYLSPPRKERNGISALDRRSMEDEGRTLPSGWLRQYDHQNHHQFFVDTNVEPPRSIWHHPYDDEQYMKGLDAVERQRIQNLQKVPSQADIAAESSDDDTDGQGYHDHSKYASPDTAELPPRVAPPAKGVTKFGRRMKDKMTQTTHEQREAQRKQRADEEQRAYQRHMEFRQAMSRAAQTGQPQFIGKGRDGKDVFIEPPQGMGAGQGGYGSQGGYGYNPYAQGPYSNANATYIRPQYPYSRPYGGGYGGGFGLPLAGGLMGGLLIGDMMGGGMMGGGMF